MTLTADQFSAHLVKTKRASFQQSLEMAELLSKRGYAVTFVGWGEPDNLSVSALLYSRSTPLGPVLTITAGPIWTNPDHLHDFYQGLKAYAKRQNALEVIVKPYDIYQTFDKLGQSTSPESPHVRDLLQQLGFQHDGLKTGYPNGEPQWHYVKDLAGLSAEQLLSSFNTNAKRLLKKARQYPITIRSLTADELHLFDAIQEATALRQGYSKRDLAYYQQFLESFKDKCDFLTAFLNLGQYQAQLLEQGAQLKQQDRGKLSSKQLEQLGQQEQALTEELNRLDALIGQYGKGEIALAAILLIYTPQETTYLFGGFYPELQQFNAAYLLQEAAMQATISRGIPRYNFLGIAGHFDQTDGVLRFKQNFNGHITRQLGDFHYYPSAIKKGIYHVLKKRH